jgi:putative inorganic carbon (HCO3(-)) transporter
MPFKSKTFVDEPEPVTRSRRARQWDENESEAGWPQEKTARPGQDEIAQADETSADETSVDETSAAALLDSSSPPSLRETRAPVKAKNWPTLRRAHALSFAGLLLFTAVTYFRPYELISALSGFKTMAFWLAIATLLVFIPTQLSAEGTLTARPREVNLALLLLLAALLSIPLAIESSEAWYSFVDFAKVITMFIVMVNVVRTERRWRVMFWLALLVSIFLSVHALGDYRAGNFKLGSDRIEGVLGGLFDNPNDMALHLVTMIPLALGLLFVARSLSRKLFYGVCALLMATATIVTFSRGGFLGLFAALLVVAWKIGRRNRFLVVVMFLMVGAVFLVIVPGVFTGRFLSVFGGDADSGSAVARQALLLKSILVTIRHPLLGVGISNFHIVSIHEQVSHNAYTQISAELGVPALIVYVLFMWSSLKRMRKIERETYESRARTRIYYLAIGLQASLIAYMVSSFFASVAYLWYIYFLVGYAVCLHRLYEAQGAEKLFARADGSKRSSLGEESKDGLVAPFTETAGGGESRTVVV